MKNKKEMIAMILAGGQGTRLSVLTQKVAKPAVPFGGKYRIIDFTLSNCVNSGIDTVGVLTQYRPHELNSYIGSGQPWDLDRMNGGVTILPPYSTANGSQWYKGTANAIFQNMEYIESYGPEYVLVLSGDHVYKMDYAKMLDFHKAKGADATIAVLEVPIDEASRFGIMNTDESEKIYEFEEKPAAPKSNKASMGVYIFTWKKLRKYLMEDEAKKDSSNDFGKNVIPDMLASGEQLYAYHFDGYWKDVGTVESLWEANMDLIDPNNPLNTTDPFWRIYARHSSYPPHYVGSEASISQSIVTEGCNVNGKLWYSVLFSGVTIEKDVSLNSAVIMQDAIIKKGAIVEYAIVANDAVIEEGAIVGSAPENCPSGVKWGIAVIGKGAVVKAGQIVAPNEIVSA